MAKSDIKDQDYEALSDQLSQARSGLLRLRFRRATGQLEDSTAIGKSRREIARLLTEMRTREIAAAEKEGAAS